MKLFSSYYDNVRNLDIKEYTFVRVSRKEPPEWFQGIVESHVDLSETFGPSPAMLKECPPNENWEMFEPRYNEEILGSIDKLSTLDLLTKIYGETGNRPLVLLCYETPSENCHRHLISGFLGIEITEL